ncbi:hypothetical protein BDFB_014738 [Asbolus verrucosus]|uniref:Uncharacterized protein n=1 Tax=Asbolus verrucosus TaxID=1661398 RepID=A0A482UZP7_ASBVE|nr:hypothetical protein BDFB_014738 [Asbolus verrucosus]
MKTNAKQKDKVVIKYYKSPKRQQSDLQILRNSYKSFSMDKKMNIPKNNNEITQMRNRNYATEYLNLTINKKLTKTDFCKSSQISINSLNKGLESLDVKIKSKKTNKITVEEDLKTVKPLIKKIK